MALGATLPFRSDFVILPMQDPCDTFAFQETERQAGAGIDGQGF